MNLSTAKMGTYVVVSILPGKGRRTLRDMGIFRGACITKRGICPKHTPVKVNVNTEKYIKLVPRKLAVMVTVA